MLVKTLYCLKLISRITVRINDAVIKRLRSAIYQHNYGAKIIAALSVQLRIAMRESAGCVWSGA